jgi:signal transduction histidine kinase
MNAGATRVAFDVAHSDDEILLTVTDDAGGFHLAEAPSGRGLWSLQREFGPGSVNVIPIESGSAVTVTIPRGA